MPDEPKPDETPKGVDATAVMDLVKSTTDTLKAIQEGQQAAPASKIGGPDPAEAAAKSQQAIAAAMEKYQDLSAEGKYGEGLQGVLEAIMTAQRGVGTPDPTKSPYWKELASRARRDVKAGNKDLFEKYGEEIEAEISALPAEQRAFTGSLEDAVAKVRMRHFGDIMDGERTKIREEEQAKIRESMLTPQNSPQAAWGEDDDTEMHGLDVEQREAARGLGVSYEQYAEQLKFEEKDAKRTRARRNKPLGPGTPILADIPAAGIKPGAF